MDEFKLYLSNELEQRNFKLNDILENIIEILQRYQDNKSLTVTSLKVLFDLSGISSNIDRDLFINDLVSKYYNTFVKETNYSSDTSVTSGNSIAHTDSSGSSITSSNNVNEYKLRSGSTVSVNSMSDNLSLEESFVELSVNAPSFEPSNSNNTSQNDILYDNYVTNEYYNEFDKVEDDFSCFESDLQYSRSHLECILYQSSFHMYDPTSIVPSYSPDVIENSLLLSNLDVFAAADIIYHNYQLISNAKPCLHVIKGSRCFRKDCYFDHELSELPCKFWFSTLEGCIVPSCPFFHGLKLPDQTSNNTPNTSSTYSSSYPSNQTNLLLNNNELFPELKSTKSSSKSTNVKTVNNGTKNNSPPENPNLLLNFKFKTISNKKNNNKLKSSNSLNNLNNNNNSNIASLHIQSLGNGIQVKSNNSTNNSSKSKVTITNQWIESGSNIAFMYQEKREEARKLAISRNKLLEEATKAYIAGSKELAKHLSSQGRALNDQMKECHLQAARQIFQSRNPKASILQGQIDMHGLHVSESVICLQELLPYLQQNNIKSISIVTGSGHHTLGSHQGQAKVLPALKLTCDELNLKYQDIIDKNGYIGGLKIRLNN